MAKRKRATARDVTPPELVVARADAEAKIADRIALGNELVGRSIRSWDELKGIRQDFYKWSDYNEELLRRLFTNGTLADEYAQAVRMVGVFGGPPNLREDVEEFHDDVKRKLTRLESIQGRLELMAEPAQTAASASSVSAGERTREAGRIFVVHGHDEAARESTARFLEKLGFDPIILHEQHSGGRTIIEKLEQYSDVDYAVVLLTPDDVGAQASGEEDLAPRARQNVILELGYFIGKLGRKNVCALHRGDVELPSDFLGVLYAPYDGAGAWRVLLAKELKAAGFEVDLNKGM